MAKEESNGTKATIREVFNMLQPIGERQIKIETILNSFIDTYKTGHKDLEDKLNKTEDCLKSKISTKAFTLWISISITILLFVVLILEKVIG